LDVLWVIVLDKLEYNYLAGLLNAQYAGIGSIWN
jgi:hypothetical protein